VCFELTSDEQLRDDLRSLNAYVVCDFAEDRIERPHPKIAVVWDRDMVFSTLLRRQADMAACLTRDFVAKASQPPGQITPRQVSWYSHAAITSSRTK